MTQVRARAPGRVNLIGDHTDYTGGLVLPMAIDLATVVTGERGGGDVVLRSDQEQSEVSVPLDLGDPACVEPAWGRYVAGVVDQVRPSVGFRGGVSSDVPVGAGLSSSAALEVAVALALGFEGTPLELATLCQRAEQRATGVPCGIMDQLASATGVDGHALRIDCTTLDVTPVPVPVHAEIVVVHSGQTRSLVGSEYANRRAQCEAAAKLIGPLATASVRDLDALEDLVLRRRARHVITENDRVDAFVAALGEERLDEAGRLMLASHASLRDDFEVSTDILDALVEELSDTPGVFGARLTGAGFGGCVVALTQPSALARGWVVRPAAGAVVE